MASAKKIGSNVVSLAPIDAPSTSSFSVAMVPRNMNEALHFCDRLSKSSVCPENLKGDPMALLVAIQAGERHGFDVLGSIQNIAVINGKPSMYGDALLGAVRASGKLVSIKETFRGTIGKDYEATCVVRRVGSDDEVTGIFTHAMAQRAELLNKRGPWKQYPERMFKMRARGFALRDAFPDVLSGLIAAEEAEDYSVRDQHGQRAQRPTGQVIEATNEQAPAPSPAAAPDDTSANERFWKGINNAQTLEELSGVQRAIREHRSLLSDAEAGALFTGYQKRKVDLSGGDKKGARGLEARLDSQQPEHDAKTGEVLDSPWDTSDVPPADYDLGYVDEAGARG